jgi:predicted nucleic acid-binding protein
MSRPSFVVDASVAAKWVLPEPGSKQARRLLRRYQEEEIDLVAPRLLLAEVGNVLWKRVRRRELTAADARICYRRLLDDSPVLLDDPNTHTAALELALAHGQTVHDSLYVALALERRCGLVTAGERLYAALHPAYPWIELL